MLAGCQQAGEGPDPGGWERWGPSRGLCLEFCPSYHLHVLNQGEITDGLSCHWHKHCQKPEVSMEDVVFPPSFLMGDRLFLGVGSKKHSFRVWNPKAPRGGQGILGSVLRFVRKLCSY